MKKVDIAQVRRRTGGVSESCRWRLHLILSSVACLCVPMMNKLLKAKFAGSLLNQPDVRLAVQVCPVVRENRKRANLRAIRQATEQYSSCKTGICLPGMATLSIQNYSGGRGELWNYWWGRRSIKTLPIYYRHQLLWQVRLVRFNLFTS